MVDMGNLLSIGLFSDASLLSVRALRRYHESGLLVPATVDRRTGYRGYSVVQLADAEIIRRLRDLDVPLDDVRRVLEGRETDITADVLAAHRRRVKARLDDAERIIGELQSLLDEPGALHQVLVHERRQRAEPILAVRHHLAIADAVAFFDEAFARLTAHVERSGAVVTGPAGGRYGDGEGFDPEGMAVEAFLTLDRPVAVGASGLVSDHLPDTRLAVALHVGPFDTMADTYRSIGVWVAEHDLRVTGPLQELYLLGPDQADPSQFRTEVGWPVAPTVPQETP